MIIVRYAEIFLKGKNRSDFERRLVENIRGVLQINDINAKVVYQRNKVLIDSNSKRALNLVKTVPGISGLSIAKKVPVDIEKIKEEVLKIVKKAEFKTFRISSKRADKKIKFTSIELDRLVGAFVVEKTKKKVSLTNPDLIIYIELSDFAYISHEKIKGIGGLPLKSEGISFCIFDGRSSLLAAKKIMRRGVLIYPVYFDEKYEKYSSIIQQISHPYKLKSFKLKKQINPAEVDLTELDLIAKKEKINTLVVTDTLNNIREYNTNMVILRPLTS